MIQVSTLLKAQKTYSNSSHAYYDSKFLQNHTHCNDFDSGLKPVNCMYLSLVGGLMLCKMKFLLPLLITVYPQSQGGVGRSGTVGRKSSGCVFWFLPMRSILKPDPHRKDIIRVIRH